MLRIETIPTGPLQANCHIVADPVSGRCVVVDPGDDAAELITFLGRERLEPEAIWNTHAHIDHINGNAGLLEKFDVPLAIHEAEEDWLRSPEKSLAAFIGITLNPSRASSIWKGGETLDALGREWQVIHTPGHSPGSVTLACPAEKLLLVGDLLMRGSVGRVDLPFGDGSALAASLRDLFARFPEDDWRFYSGHGPGSDLGLERRDNWFVSQALGATGAQPGFP